MLKKILLPIRDFFSTISSLFNFIWNKFLFKIKKTDYVTFPKINGRLNVFKNGSISLGQGVKINSGKKFNVIGGDVRTVFTVSDGASLKIDDFTGISNTTIICQNEVSIGKHVNIGGSCKLYDTDFHALDYQARMQKATDIPVTKPIVIKDHAFIGAHSIVLKGVTIGERSIIGAGSIVTKSVPDGEIWAGNPAKFIKKVL